MSYTIKKEFYTRTEYYNSKGDLHRQDGPAIEWKDGRKEWFINGQRHRENGPAVEGDNFCFWYKNGKCHNDDGPAIDFKDIKKWYKEGKLHREDGPAIEYFGQYKEWFLNGICYSEEEYNEKIK